MKIRDVQIKTKVGCTMVLKDIRHASNLRLNLFLRTTLDKQGYDLHFGSDTWKLTKEVTVVNKGHVCGTLYRTHVKICENNINVVKDGASLNLWHEILGQMGEKG